MPLYKILQREHARLAFKVSLALATVSTIFDAADLIWGGPTFTLDLPKLVYLWVTTFILYRGFQFLGTWMLLLGINFIILYFAAALGPDFRIQLGFMPAMILPFILLNSEKKRYKLILSALPFACFGALELTNFNLPFIERIDQFPASYRFFVVLANFGLMSFCAYLFFRNTQKANEQIKKHVDKLERKEAFVSTLIEGVPAMIYAKDLEGRYVLANKNLLDLFKKPLEQVLGRRHSEVMPSLNDECELSDQMALASPKPIDVLETIKTPEGDLHFRTIKFPMRDTNNEPYSVCGVTFNITEQMKTEKTLHERNELFRKMADNISEAFWLTSPEHQKVYYLSPAIEKIWEQPLSKFMSGDATWLDSIHPDDIERVRKLFMAPGPREELEYRIVCPSGRIKWIWDRLFQIKDESGNLSYICGVCTDITDKKAAEGVIEEQRARIVSASKLSAIGEMAGGIAHEINNPLAIIHAKAGQLREMIEEDGALPKDELARSAERIEANAMRISRIVKSLRMFSRDGENEPFHVTSCKELIDEALDLCREKFKNHGIEIRLNVEQIFTSFECRPVQIGQVLLNLLNNSYDAVKTLPDKWVSIDVKEVANHIHIAVTDSGSGIPVEIRDKILQPFFTTKPVGEGTGLGLSISKGIVDAHHGTLTLDTDCSNTCFVLRLPRTQKGARHDKATG